MKETETDLRVNKRVDCAGPMYNNLQQVLVQLLQPFDMRVSFDLITNGSATNDSLALVSAPRRFKR